MNPIKFDIKKIGSLKRNKLYRKLYLVFLLQNKWAYAGIEYGAYN